MKLNTKKVIKISLLLLVFAIWPVAITTSLQPPLPPEIDIIVCDTRYTPNTMPIFEQFTSDAALCGIILNIIPMGYYDTVMSLFSGDYDIVMFINIAWYLPDSFDTIIWYLDYYFGETNLWKYHNDILDLKIQELKDYYYGGFEEEAITIFHEIELIIYEEQAYPAIGYHFDSSLIHTHQLIVNCDPDRPCNNLAIRKALSYLIDRDIYVSSMQLELTYDLFKTSHLFGWSQYHDATLPEIYHSIGKAASTLAKAGFRPRALK